MKDFVAVDSKGVIISKFTLVDAEEAELNRPHDAMMVEGNVDQKLCYYDYQSQSFEMYPTRPSIYHDWNGFDWIDNRTAGIVANDLQLEKDDAIATINTMIGKIRSRFVTVIPAQDMLYQAKEAEAKAYLSDPVPVDADYPFIQAEIGITGDNAWQVAQVYVNQALILRHVAAQLETVRLGNIALVEAASDVGAVEAALSSFNQVLGAL